MKEPKTLDLHVTVSCLVSEPDHYLSRMNLHDARLSQGGVSLKITAISRADGLPFGAEAEFEAWWSAQHEDGCDDDPVARECEKFWAREAWMHLTQRH